MYTLVTGGQMVNKGAQAMTFIIMDEICKRFPEDEILLLLPGDASTIDSERYRIRGCTLHIKSAYYLIGGAAKLVAIARKVDRDDAKQLDGILRQARMLVDISGYALGSNWSDYLVRYYLCAFQLAHRYGVPICVMPQSFGPFDYPFPKSLIANWYIRKVMRYPDVIFAREREGLELLEKKYRLKQVRHSEDMVLLSDGVDPARVFRAKFQPAQVSIEAGSVALIPNVRLLDRVSRDRVLELYAEIGAGLRRQGKKIYLLSHSDEDQRFSAEISALLNGRGIENGLLAMNLNCLEFEAVIAQFDFIVASRYHAIVHAYRSGVPCIALGWAVKYEELLREFGQQNYSFQIDALNREELLSALRAMCARSKQEGERISAHIEEMRSLGIFDVLDGMGSR